MKKSVFKITYICVAISLLISVLSGCNMPQPTTIADIAYDANCSHGYTVYIQEAGEYVPYLVLSKDYGGNTLLLRKYLMDTPRAFDEESGYYENCLLDQYLNSDFSDLLSSGLQKRVADTQVTIVTMDWLWHIAGDPDPMETFEIERKYFLLSFSEISTKKMRVINDEGDTLKYFKDDRSRRMANLEGHEATVWWTRSAFRSQSGAPVGTSIGPNGGPGAGNSYNLNYVRPAFCISGITEITRERSVNGEPVYTIKDDI